MNHLLKQLRSHWVWVLIIVLAHIVQAYTILLLPSYTSDLVDVGIQNRGYEYSVPYQLSSPGYQVLASVIENEEVNLADIYRQNDEGYYVLSSEIANAENQLRELDQYFVEPMAVLGQLQNEQSVSTLPQARELVTATTDAYGQATVHNQAVQAALVEYDQTGYPTVDHQMSYLWSKGGAMLIIAVLSFLAAIVAFYLASRVGARIGFDLRSDVFNRVLQFSQKEMNEFSTATLITRTTNDIQQIQLILTITLRAIIFAPLLAVGGIIYVMQTQSSMSWIILLAVILIIILVGILLYITMPRFRILQNLVDRLNLIAREILTGLQVVRAFGKQEHETERFRIANIDLYDTYLMISRTMSVMLPLMLLLANGISVLIVWIGSRHIANGTMQVGEMMAFITYTLQVIFGFLNFSLMSMQIPRAVISARRVEEVIITPLSVDEPLNPQIIEQPKGQVRFENVSFSFEEANENALENISFVAEPGETTAIIGSTGSGKSTIFNLLLRFFDVNEGKITIDGIDIRQLSSRQLRDMIGYVPQKGILFSGTIESNIAYGNQSITEAEMKRAARIAHAEEFIVEKPARFQAPISQGGSNVSGGQKQRLSIARAIAKNPNIFLFDDSFSALDYRTDASLRQVLNEEIQEATKIIIAQRVSTILEAEKIIVLDEGRIDGIGTHQELMSTSSVYQEIARSQLSSAELQAKAKRDAVQFNQLGWEG